MTTVCEALRRHAERSPDRLLFQFHGSGGRAAETYSYGSLLERVEVLAAALEALAPAGARALIAHPPGLEGVAALLACARVGLIGVPVPLSATDKSPAGRRLLAVAADCGPVLALTDGPNARPLRRLLGGAGTFAGQVVATDGLQAGAGRPRREPGDVLLLQYTSGSTGQPRGVVVTHRNLAANARATLDHRPIGVSWLPQHHDMGLIGFYLFPILAGGSSHGFAPGDFLRKPALWLRLISEVGATYTAAPNFGFEHCLRPRAIRDEELAGVNLSSLRVLMNASEPARPRTIGDFCQRFRACGLSEAASSVAYGLAENTLAVTLGGRRRVRVGRAALGRSEVKLHPAGSDADGLEIASCGRPLRGVRLTLRDQTTGARLGPGRVGEIEVAGPSVTPGYWPLPASGPRRTLRTGDLGFLWEGDLYVCGRIKDVLIVAGVNHHPQDLERAAEEGAGEGEAGLGLAGACALQTGDGTLVVLAEAGRGAGPPLAAAIAAAVSRRCGVRPDLVLLVPPRTIVRTTSGKVARAETRALVEGGTLRVLARHDSRAPGPDGLDGPEDWQARLRNVLHRAGVADPRCQIGASGLDSLTLTELQLDLQALLERQGIAGTDALLDGALLQELTTEDLLRCLSPLDQGDRAALAGRFRRKRSEVREGIGGRMRADRVLEPWDRQPVRKLGDILLTGATGFFGAFLLSELLRQTGGDIHVLVRCPTAEAGLWRVRAALERTGLLPLPALEAALGRVRVLPGDLEAPRWGLSSDAWAATAERIGEIYHNGARVNYVAPYGVLRGPNVEGTRTALRLALESGSVLHHVSTTFVFGWARTPVLFEHACNEGMEALDFGYAQSKWVAEQLVLQARERGMLAHVYRPSLLSVSRGGVGDASDVALRTLAFMVSHGVAADAANQLSILPVDQAAANLIAVSRQDRDHPATFHVVADRYHSIVDLTREMARVLGIGFDYVPVPRFVERLNALSRPSDPVYPLLDFFTMSSEHIAAMSMKRYNSSGFRRAKAKVSPAALPDPSIATVARLMAGFLEREGLVPSALGGRPVPDGGTMDGQAVGGG